MDLMLRYATIRVTMRGKSGFRIWVVVTAAAFIHCRASFYYWVHIGSYMDCICCRL